MKPYQPKTGARCGCRRGVQRDNCPNCEGTGYVIDFAQIRRASSAELFRADVRRAINLAIAKLDSGTVGISADNLWQLTRIVSSYGPPGVNSAWAARQVFNTIIKAPPYSRFVYENQSH